MLILHNKALYTPFTRYYDDDEINEDDIGPFKMSC